MKWTLKKNDPEVLFGDGTVKRQNPPAILMNWLKVTHIYIFFSPHEVKRQYYNHICVLRAQRSGRHVKED